TQGRYGHDIKVNTASTSITTASINLTAAEPVTTVSASVTTASVSVSTVEPSTPPITTTLIEDEDLIIPKTLMKMRKYWKTVERKLKAVENKQFALESIRRSLEFEIMEVHHFFVAMLNAFDRDELVMMWSLVKKKFNSTEPTNDKEREIWVELKRLFELDTDDEEGNRHLHAGREGVSNVKRNSYIDADQEDEVFGRIFSHLQDYSLRSRRVFVLGLKDFMELLVLREMDLKWQLELLSMRAKRFFQKTRRKITINGSDTAIFDNSRVECYNNHKMGHFLRECRQPRNQDSMSWNQDSSRRTMNVEDIPPKAMVAIDRVGFDWSYMTKVEVPTNMALMDFLDSEVYTNNTCSKTCLKRNETLKKQYDDLRVEFNKSEFNLATYKRGLIFIEEQVVFYKKNEVIFCEQIDVLKRNLSYRDSEISGLKSELENLKKEKESTQLKLENFDHTFKSLDKLIGSQITNKSTKGVGFESYNVVPPPPTVLFSPPNIDLSYSGLEEFKQSKVESYGPKSYKIESKNASENIPNELKESTEVKESIDVPLVKKLVSDDKLEKKTVVPTTAKIEFVKSKQQEKPVKKPVKYVEMYRSQGPRGNQRNWNNLKSQQLGSNFVMYNKACFICGSFEHVQANCNYHHRERVQTAAANTLDTGEVQITATIDGKVKLVSEASIRRHLKLEDSDGISTLPNIEIFEQLALMGYGEGSTVPVESHHTPLDEAASTGVDVRHGGATTTVTSLDTWQGSGNIDKTPYMPHDFPLLRVNTLRNDEGTMSLQELTVLCTTLSQKIDSLEADLKQTKQVYRAAYTKLIMKVKRLEKTVKSSQARRRAKIVVSDDKELEDPSKQGRSMVKEIDQDAEVTLVTPIQVLADAAKVHIYTRRRRAISTASGGISTAEESVSTASVSMLVSTAGMIDKAVRLQERLDEEERQRIARVHEEASSFNVEEWKDMKVKKRVAEEELKQEESLKRQKTGEGSEPIEEPKADVLSQENLQQLMMIDLVKERFSTTKPTDDKEKELWVKLKRLFEPDNDDTLWKLQSHFFTSIDYKPKSPTSSTSLSTNSYLNLPPPPRVLSPPLTQESGSMDITLTLSPITPLDMHFNTPSPSPPLFGHPIPWNLLEAHGDSCLCCIHSRTLIFVLRDELQYMFSYIEHMLSQPPFPNTSPPPSLSQN
nr:ribonuclease H-like domain-containing protein [Tanacetum cinerariifolium]